MIDVDLDSNLDWITANFGQEHCEKAVDAAISVAALDSISNSSIPIGISIKLSDDTEVHALNHEYRDKDKPTNVLSFPMLDQDDFEQIGKVNVDAPEILLGDIILAYETCASEAAEKGISLPDHAAHLVVHGTLHLLGYDHTCDDDAAIMEALEVKALASMGLANPYSDKH